VQVRSLVRLPAADERRVAGGGADAARGTRAVVGQAEPRPISSCRHGPAVPPLISSVGDLRRLAIDMLREAGRPLAIKEMALAALKATGIRYPDRRTMRITRTRLRGTFGKPQTRGMARTAGTGNATKRTLVA